ncbi:MAG: IreB family regulatory phosphoprotein [Oscillospiraceae bacterium]|nr:IreB family regulatory phosphoprotein [Oscillospiraceae bacterium]
MAYQKNEDIKKALDEVYSVMTAKGYKTIDQMTGFIVNNDPSYLSGSVRSAVRNFDVDEIVEELFHVYFDL